MGSGEYSGLSHTLWKNRVPRSLARLWTPRAHLGASAEPPELRGSDYRLPSTSSEPPSSQGPAFAASDSSQALIGHIPEESRPSRGGMYCHERVVREHFS